MTQESHVEARPCRKCGVLFVGARCKPCKKILDAAWRKNNPGKQKASINKAAIDKAYRVANKDAIKIQKAQYLINNRGEINAKNAKWRAKNPEKSSLCSAKYREKNPNAARIYQNARRSRELEASGSLSDGLPEKLFKLQKGKCACCKKPLGDNYHMDHIQPLAKGGTNTDDNMQLLTARCNLQKHAKDPIEFMQSRGYLL